MARRKGAPRAIPKVIVLDTNVVSELMRPKPDVKVTSWLNGLTRQEVWITTISIFELRFGIEIHAKGQRRSQLEDSLARILEVGFHDRVLNFDEKAANAAALLSAKQRIMGRSKEVRDTFIAGIVSAHRADLATRNARHFQGLDIRVIDPWAN
jgi:predicted nucleic acid-binding protein